MSTTETKTQTPTPAEIPFTTPQAMVRFVTDTGKILPRKYTGMSAKQQREVTRKIKRARPQDRPQGRRFRAVLVNEFGRMTLESAGRATREQARRETARLIYAAGLITPSADNPGGYTGSGGGRIPPNIPEN